MKQKRETYERIHRSNLVGMGIVPLQFEEGESAESLGLTGREIYSIPGVAAGLASGFADGRTITVTAVDPSGSTKQFTATIRIDTPQEIEYVKHGGILQYVLRNLAS